MSDHKELNVWHRESYVTERLGLDSRLLFDLMVAIRYRHQHTTHDLEFLVTEELEEREPLREATRETVLYTEDRFTLDTEDFGKVVIRLPLAQSLSFRNGSDEIEIGDAHVFLPAEPSLDGKKHQTQKMHALWYRGAILENDESSEYKNHNMALLTLVFCHHLIALTVPRAEDDYFCFAPLHVLTYTPPLPEKEPVVGSQQQWSPVRSKSTSRSRSTTPPVTSTKRATAYITPTSSTDETYEMRPTTEMRTRYGGPGPWARKLLDQREAPRLTTDLVLMGVPVRFMAQWMFADRREVLQFLCQMACVLDKVQTLLRLQYHALSWNDIGLVKHATPKRLVYTFDNDKSVVLDVMWECVLLHTLCTHLELSGTAMISDEPFAASRNLHALVFDTAMRLQHQREQAGGDADEELYLSLIEWSDLLFDVRHVDRDYVCDSHFLPSHMGPRLFELYQQTEAKKPTTRPRRTRRSN